MVGWDTMFSYDDGQQCLPVMSFVHTWCGVIGRGKYLAHFWDLKSCLII